MTEPQIPPVDPFALGDPLCYPELTPEQSAIRALLAVLADTGRSVVFPRELAPSELAMHIAGGWTLIPGYAPGPTNDTLVLAAWRGWLGPHGTQPPAVQP